MVRLKISYSTLPVETKMYRSVNKRKEWMKEIINSHPHLKSLTPFKWVRILSWASSGPEFINNQRQIGICISPCRNDLTSSSCSQGLGTPAMCMTFSPFLVSNKRKKQTNENPVHPLNNITDPYLNTDNT